MDISFTLTLVHCLRINFYVDPFNLSNDEKNLHLGSFPFAIFLFYKLPW